MNFISTISSFIGYTSPNKMEQTHFLDNYNDRLLHILEVLLKKK